MAPISGKYKQAANIASMDVLVEHCAFLETVACQWFLDVRCRSGKQEWDRLRDACPEAKVVVKSNDIVVSLPPLPEELELTVFGKPGECDMKRMQLCIFGRKPVVGKDWVISVYLCDDTVMAFENVHKREEKKGNKLLTTRAGLFVANSNEDIKISVNTLETGWQIKGSGTKTIKSRNAWNSPENATDFPCLKFEVCHVDEMKQSFFCGITASHGTDIAEAEIRAFFKQENEEEKIDNFFKVCKELQANDNWTGYPEKIRSLPARLERKITFKLDALILQGSLDEKESVVAFLQENNLLMTSLFLFTVLMLLCSVSCRELFRLFLIPVWVCCLLYIPPVLVAYSINVTDFLNTTSFRTGLVGWMVLMFPESRFKETCMSAKRRTTRVLLSFVVWMDSMSPEFCFTGTLMSAIRVMDLVSEKSPHVKPASLATKIRKKKTISWLNIVMLVLIICFVGVSNVSKPAAITDDVCKTDKVVILATDFPVQKKKPHFALVKMVIIRPYIMTRKVCFTKAMPYARNMSSPDDNDGTRYSVHRVDSLEYNRLKRIYLDVNEGFLNSVGQKDNPKLTRPFILFNFNAPHMYTLKNAKQDNHGLEWTGTMPRLYKVKDGLHLAGSAEGGSKFCNDTMSCQWKGNTVHF